MADNKNIVLIGLSGCGKTTIGEQIAGIMGYDFVDIDNMITEKYGPIPELFAVSEEHFRRCETNCTIQASKMDRSVIATGGGVVLKKENMDALKRTGKVFFLNRSVENIMKDVVTETRPLLADGKEKLYELHNQRIGLYNKYADVTIDSNQTIEKVISDIISHIKEG